MANDTSQWGISLQKNTNGWNGANVVPAALSGLRMITDGMPLVVPESIDDEAIGDIFPGDSHFTRQRGSGALGDTYARYEGLERIVAFAIGDSTTPAASGATWDYELDPTAGLTSVLQHIIDKNEGVPWIWDSVMLNGFELKVADGLVVITPQIITSTTKRAAASFTSVTFPTEALVINFNDLVVRTNVASAGALASPTDVIKISDFTFAFTRPMEGDPVNNTDGTDDIPLATGFPETTLTLSFPSLLAANDALLSAAPIILADHAPTYYKADLVFTGPDNAGTTREFILELPRLKIMNPEALGAGPHQKVPVKVEFKAYRSAVVPTGMFANIPFRFKLNGSSNGTNPL